MRQRRLQHLASECRLALRDQGYWGALCLISLLTLLAFYSGWEYASRWQERAESYQLENEQAHQILKMAFLPEPERYRFEEALGKSLNAAEEGRAKELQSTASSALSMANLTDTWKTWLPPSHLTVLATGESNQLPASYLVKGNSVAGTLAVSRLINPFHESTGLFDLSLLVIVILPLAVIVVLYDLVSREEELKTSRLLQIQSGSLTKVMLTRILIRVSGLTLAICVMVLICLLIAGVPVWELELLQKFVAWSGIVLVYTGFWAGICWLVNVFRWPSMTNILVLSVCWVMLVFVSPSVFVHSLVLSTPVDSVEKLQQIEDGLAKSSQFALDELIRQEEEYEDEITEELQAEWEARSERLLKDYEQQFQEIVEKHHQQVESRIQKTRDWDWLVPALLVKESSSLLAGTSRQHFQDFARQTCEYIQAYQQHFQQISQERDELLAEDLTDLPVYRNPDLERKMNWSVYFWQLTVLTGLVAALFVTGVLVNARF